MEYKDIVTHYGCTPKELTTAGRNLWFKVYSAGGQLMVEGSKTHEPASQVKPRPLKVSEYIPMLQIWQRIKNGENMEAQAMMVSKSRIYWYAVFRDLNL